MSDYARLGWQVRLIGAESWPELLPAAQRLCELPMRENGPTVWFTVASHAETRWDVDFRCRSARRRFQRAKKQFVRSMARIFHWQRCSSVLESHRSLRRSCRPFWWVIYSATGASIWDMTWTSVPCARYCMTLRTYGKTWRTDKSGRAEQVHNYQSAWDDPPVIGLGMRLGPFWYPVPVSEPPQPVGAVEPNGHGV